jgi:hypothetical protein
VVLVWHQAFLVLQSHTRVVAVAALITGLVVRAALGVAVLVAQTLATQHLELQTQVAVVEVQVLTQTEQQVHQALVVLVLSLFVMLTLFQPQHQPQVHPQ